MLKEMWSCVSVRANMASGPRSCPLTFTCMMWHVHTGHILSNNNTVLKMDLDYNRQKLRLTFLLYTIKEVYIFTTAFILSF